MNVSLKKCKTLGISKNLIEYLNIPIIKNGKFSYISEEDLSKALHFKENNNTRVILQKMTFIKKYGVENPQQLKEIREKSIITIKNKYGVDNVSKLDEVKQKKINTSLKNYGKKNPSQSEKIINKVKKTKFEKYQDESYGSFNSEIHKNTMLEKYGVKNPMQNNDLKNKAFNTKKLNKEIELKKYQNLISVFDLCQKYERCYDCILDILKIQNVEIVNIKCSYFINESDLCKIEEYIKNSSSKRISFKEKEIYNFIHSIYKDLIIENDRNTIYPLELDIYIPNKHVAIEFNGIYYHSNKFKDKYYHYNKTKLCKEKGIRLIHIYEDDWNFNKDIVKSMIKSALGVYDRKIFARKCIIKEIDREQYKKFMNTNHLQGFTNSTHYVGLFYNDELVQSVGINKNGLNKIWELNRMSTSLNTQVIGGFSKLIKYSLNAFDIKEMNSYVFKGWFDGKGYEKVGFKFDTECPPTYWFIINGRKTNRMNFQKNKIKKKVESGELKYYNENETEFENMAKNGINWIWDCGKIRLKIINNT